MLKLTFFTTLLLCVFSSTFALAGYSSVAKEAVTLANQGNYTEAAEKFNEAIAQDPQNAGLYFAQGMVYKSLTRYEDAIRMFEKAAELNPSMTQAYYSLGLLYESRAINHASPDMWHKAKDAWQSVLYLEKEQGRKNAARKHLEKINEQLGE